MSALTSCNTINKRQKNWHDPRIAHFSEAHEINKGSQIKQGIVRKPNLQKLKIFTPNIVKAGNSNKEKEGEAFIVEEVKPKKSADLIEEEKPYSRLDMIMLWLAITSSCIIVWCSIWFVGRYMFR
tara:strand:- start:773 stop:1147 length:375 start_codon:yes stop_codon:yes gene_type:complete